MGKYRHRPSWQAGRLAVLAAELADLGRAMTVLARTLEMPLETVREAMRP